MPEPLKEEISSLQATMFIFIPLLIWYAIGWFIFPEVISNIQIDELEGADYRWGDLPIVMAGVAISLGLFLWYFITMIDPRLED